MKKLLMKSMALAVIVLFTSLKSKDDVGYVTLEVSYLQTMGGSATIQNTATSEYYYLNAVDTYDQIEVPYGSYVLVSAANNNCGSPLIQGVTTSTGYTSFVIDGDNQGFTIYASCY